MRSMRVRVCITIIIIYANTIHDAIIYKYICMYMYIYIYRYNRAKYLLNFKSLTKFKAKFTSAPGYNIMVGR